MAHFQYTVRFGMAWLGGVGHGPAREPMAQYKIEGSGARFGQVRLGKARQGKGANGSFDKLKSRSMMLPTPGDMNMKADKYRQTVDRLYNHFLSFNKGDTVHWPEIERIMGMVRDDLGGRRIVKRLIRDILQRRHITCLVGTNVGVRLLTDMEAAVEVPKMRQKRAKRQIRRGLKETEHVELANLTDRAAQSLAHSRRVMREEQKKLVNSIREVTALMKPTVRVF